LVASHTKLPAAELLPDRGDENVLNVVALGQRARSRGFGQLLQLSAGFPGVGKQGGREAGVEAFAHGLAPTRAQTAAANSRVEALPPRSPVRMLSLLSVSPLAVRARSARSLRPV